MNCTNDDQYSQICPTIDCRFIPKSKLDYIFAFSRDFCPAEIFQAKCEALLRIFSVIEFQSPIVKLYIWREKSRQMFLHIIMHRAITKKIYLIIFFKCVPQKCFKCVLKFYFHTQNRTQFTAHCYFGHLVLKR